MNTNKDINQSIINHAIDNEKERSLELWNERLKQSCDGGSSSLYPGITDPAVLEKMLLDADWRNFSHGHLTETFMSFKAPIKGLLTVVNLKGINEALEITLTLDNTANALVAVIPKEDVRLIHKSVAFTVITLSNYPDVKDKNIFKTFVASFQPGQIAIPSRFKIRPELIDVKVTVKNALSMGWRHAKLV